MTTDIFTRNFFELFDVPVSYDIDLSKVQHQYRELQKAVHPDKFVNASAQEKRLSMQQTSLVNEAFHTIKQPIDRASYLLKLKGVDITIKNETTMDVAFLTEQMELRESLHEAQEKPDPLDELDNIAAKLKNTLKKYESDFVTAYDKGELESAKEVIRKMQFTQKAMQQVDDMAEKLDNN